MNQAASPKILLTHFDWTLSRLQEILNNEKTDYFRDAALERFGFTYDMAVKCLQALSHTLGEPCETPDECFAFSIKMKLLDQEENGRRLIDAYKAIKQPKPVPEADGIFASLPEFIEIFKQLRSRFEKHVSPLS